MVLDPASLTERGRKTTVRKISIRVKASLRKWRQLFRETAQILAPIDTAILVATHILFVFAEDFLATTGLMIWGQFPREIPSRHPARGTIILAPGLQQSPFSCYPFGWFLANVFRFRVLLLQTPENGNHHSFEDIVVRNSWISQTHDTDPLVGIGFSKGGQDLVWLFSTMLINKPSRHTAIVMMSAPLRGSKMAKVVKTPGAQALLPGTREITSTLFLVNCLHEVGVHFKFYCAIWDRIVRRSDSRPENVEHFTGQGTPPWYWSQTLWFQFGHTAIYNPLAWIQVGRYVSRLLPQLG